VDPTQSSLVGRSPLNPTSSYPGFLL
jgi:hypothetical protein